MFEVELCTSRRARQFGAPVATVEHHSRPGSFLCRGGRVCAVGVEILRGGGAPRFFLAAARAAAGADSLLAILLVSFAVAPMIGSRRRGS